MSCWSKGAIFYHIFPLGFCGAPKHNDFVSETVPRLEKIYKWIEHIKYLGADSIYFGPVFESDSHGYDTVDYFTIDRRLGDNATFARLVDVLHENGIKVVIDGVFNHVGRNFKAFKDILANGAQSRYCDWFYELDFNKKSPLNDPFNYSTWHGFYNLVKLNLKNPEVREYIFRAVAVWISEFDIDGLRLDCADCLDFDFMSELSHFCKGAKADFWLMGEVIHGDYGRWANINMIDSVTNYECYKGLFSSHNDKNYFEIAYSFNRQFGEEHGIYANLYLYNFADNHDVNRIGSTLKNPAHIYPLYALLFTMSGIPSIYYGSEWGIKGTKNSTDEDLRPEINSIEASLSGHNKDLERAVSKFAQIRKSSSALMHGRYLQLKVAHEQFAFARMAQDECMIVIVNSSDKCSYMEIDIPVEGVRAVDILNNNETFEIKENKCRIHDLYPCWARILRVER